MSRNINQRLADKRYALKIAEEGRYKQFKVSLEANEYDCLKEALACHGLSNVDFVRIAYSKLIESKN